MKMSCKHLSGYDEFTIYKLLFVVPNIAILTNCLYIYYFSEESILRSDWNEKNLLI